MKKRLLSLALSLVMLLTMLPVTVWAEGDVAEAMDEVSVPLEAVSFPGDEDNDQLLMGYLYQQSRVALEADAGIINSAVSYPAMNALALDEINQNVYDVLRERIIDVAASGGSTEFFVPIVERKTYSYDEYAAYADDAKNGVKLEDGTEMSFQEYYQTYFVEEGRSLDDFACDLIEKFFYQYDKDVISAFQADFKLQIVVNALLGNLPYELYWFDKTVGVVPMYTVVATTDGETIYADYGVYLLFCTSENYCSSTAPRKTVTVIDNGQQIDKTYILEVDSDKALAANNFAANARKVIRDNVGRTDAEKLAAYMNAIKEATAYNTSAADKTTNTPYGDPWQLIYVFDGNEDTNVVCEGYAKAFKFLCDLSYWRDKTFRCSLVTGGLQIDNKEPESHMWNIVHISDVNNPSGANFLVDVTNCDTGTVGAPDELFMKAPNGRQGLIHSYSIGSRYVYYIYDNFTQMQFSDDELSLAANDYTPAASTASKPVLMWKNGFMTPEGVIFEDNGSDTLYVEAFNTFRGKLIYRDETGTETELVPDENAFILEDESFLSMVGYDPKSNLLSIRAEKVGETTLLHEDAILTIHSGMPLVAFSSQRELAVDSILTQWEYNGSNTVYLAWQKDASDVKIAADPNSHTQVEVVDRGEGYAVIGITDYHEDDIELEVSLQIHGKEQRRHVSLPVIAKLPGIGFRQVEGDWNDDNGQFRPTEEPISKEMHMGLGGTAFVQIVFTDGDGHETPLSAKDLTFEGIKLRKTLADGAYLLLEGPTQGEGSVTYRVGDKPYRMYVYVDLPDVAFYTSAQAEAGELTGEWVYIGEDIYLVATQDVVLKSVTPVTTGVTATLNEDGTCATIHLEQAADIEEVSVNVELERDGRTETRDNLTVGFLRADVVIDAKMPADIGATPTITLQNTPDHIINAEVRSVGGRLALVHVPAGDYQMSIALQGCVPNTVAITVPEHGMAEVKASLVALGDVNGAVNEQGQAVDVSDMQCLFVYLSRGTIDGALAEDEAYFRSVADVNNDGLVNILDYQTLYEMVKAQ